MPEGILDAAGDATRAAAAAVSSALRGSIPEAPEEGDEASTAAEQYVLAAARSALWDLFQLLFIVRGEGHYGSVAPGFVQWARSHTLALSTGVPADISKCALWLFRFVWCSL